MPVYNCQLYINEAINSILNQTEKDFEFIIIDDASTDKTVSIIKKFNDSRIQLIQKPINTGLSNSLNLGLQLAKGKYIARMDGDDISLSLRFAKQVAFLEANQNVIVCGTWFSIIGSNRIIKLPEDHDAIKLAFLKGNCMAHPSVMMRRRSLDELHIVYDVLKEPAEDYDLWVRLISKGIFRNLQEVLLHYRIHNSQVSKKNGAKQKQSVFETKRNLFNLLELELLSDERIVLNKVLNNGLDINYNDINVFKKVQIKLLKSNTKALYEPIGFKKEMLNLEKIVINSYFLKRNNFVPKTYFEYLKIKYSLHFKLDIKSEIKLALKSLIFYKS